MSERGKIGSRQRRPRVGLLRILLEHLATEVKTFTATTRKTRRRSKRKLLQCFLCQRLGHVAQSCTATPACLRCAQAHDTRECTEKRDAPKRCANCGGPHTANFRRCPYIVSWCNEREKRRAIGGTSPEKKTPAHPLPPRQREGGGRKVERRSAHGNHRPSTDDAIRALQAAMADERARYELELAAARRRIDALERELSVLKADLAAPRSPPHAGEAAWLRAIPHSGAHVAPGGASPAPVTSPRSSTTSLEMDLASAQEADGDDGEEGARNDCLPMPTTTSVQAVLKKIASSIEDNSYPHFDNPYPFLSPSQKPNLPYVPSKLTHDEMFPIRELISRKEFQLINAHPVFSRNQWKLVAELANGCVLQRMVASSRRKHDTSSEDTLSETSTKSVPKKSKKGTPT